MKIIGLTGGIGSGKSTVSAYMKEHGCIVLDADEIARALTSPGGPALTPILLEFGVTVFNESGSLNRKKLAGIIFKNPVKKAKLEEITTKVVIQEIEEQIRHLSEDGFDGVVVIDAPLLFEYEMHKKCDENWLVTASTETKIRRVRLRDGLSREEIIERMNAQMPDSEKEELADITINNSLGLDWLYQQIDRQLYRLR